MITLAKPAVNHLNYLGMTEYNYNVELTTSTVFILLLE